MEHILIWQIKLISTYKPIYRTIYETNVVNNRYHFVYSEPYNPQSEILVIESVTNDDEGSYMCEGKNSAGTDTKRIQLQIEDVDDNSITETPPCRGDITCSQPQILDPDYHVRFENCHLFFHFHFYHLWLGFIKQNY